MKNKDYLSKRKRKVHVFCDCNEADKVQVSARKAKTKAGWDDEKMSKISDFKKAKVFDNRTRQAAMAIQKSKVKKPEKYAVIRRLLLAGVEAIPHVKPHQPDGSYIEREYKGNGELFTNIPNCDSNQ